MSYFNKLLFLPFPCSKIFYQMGRVKFPLPDLGEKIKEGTIKKLYVGEGQKVEEFQKIADVESDKQFTEITAPEEGKIAKIYYQETEVCKVGDLFMQIETEENHEEEMPLPVKSEIAQVRNQINKYKEQPLASGVVKMYASAYDVNLQEVRGTGRNNRILKQDILAYIEGNELQKKKFEKKGFREETKQAKQYGQRKIRMNAYQQGMQKSMSEANEVPHLYYHETINVSELENLRQKLKKMKTKVTMMGLLTKTFSLALNSHPKINSTYKPDKTEFQFETHESHNISIAIDSPGGLVAPNIKNVQALSILEIQQKLEELKILSLQNKLTSSELLNGTICLSNIGTIGGRSACPLMLCPQTCIVAIGRVVETPVYINGNLFNQKHITLSYGCDHRVIDGASVSRFSNEWKNIIENPQLALIRMH